jgi:hypothetical protein
LRVSRPLPKLEPGVNVGTIYDSPADADVIAEHRARMFDEMGQVD